MLLVRRHTHTCVPTLLRSLCASQRSPDTGLLHPWFCGSCPDPGALLRGAPAGTFLVRVAPRGNWNALELCVANKARKVDKGGVQRDQAPFSTCVPARPPVRPSVRPSVRPCVRAAVCAQPAWHARPSTLPCVPRWVPTCFACRAMRGSLGCLC